MEKPNVINFSDFFQKGEDKPTFNKEDFKDFFLDENSEINESVYEEETDDLNLEVEEVTEKFEEEHLSELFSEEEFSVEEVTEHFEEEEEIEPIEEKEENDMENENFYPLYKDKSETFSCDVAVEGADLNDTSVRLIVESDEWTLMFNGEVDKKGKCNIPIKKLGLFNEGTTGKIRLEVIAEGTVFTPWEDDFKVKLSKKVEIKLNESKTLPKKPEMKKAGVKVNVRR